MMEVDETNENGVDFVIPELKEMRYFWFYYDEEDELTKLMEACNLKGIRERKL